MDNLMNKFMWGVMAIFVLYMVWQFGRLYEYKSGKSCFTCINFIQQPEPDYNRYLLLKCLKNGALE